MKTYILTKDRFEHKAGTKIYEFYGYDYGCSRDDTYYLGVYHKAMTLNPNGEGPFFTVPETDFTFWEVQ